MTRNGKIARLPAAIRRQLNQRLFDGGQGKQLVQWLNGLPNVQAILKAQFKGNPITATNLSQWKNGGYSAWEAGERMADNLSSIVDRCAALQTTAKDGLAGRTTLILAASMAIEMQRLQSMPEGIEKARMWRELRIGLLALRKTELLAQRLRLEQAQIDPLPAAIQPLSVAVGTSESKSVQVNGTK
jgi:hypothetical protein